MRSSLLLTALLFASVAQAAQPTTRPSDEQRGETLYRRHCVACHGVRNGGQGPATSALVHPVPLLQGKVTVGDDHVRAVLKGTNAMPGFEASFDRPDAVRVLKYMRSLGPEKALPPRPTRDEKKVPPRKLPPQKVEKKVVPPPPKDDVPDGPEPEDE